MTVRPLRSLAGARAHRPSNSLQTQPSGGRPSASRIFATNLLRQVDRKVLEEAFVKFGDLKTVSSSLCGVGGWETTRHWACLVFGL